MENYGYAYFQLKVLKLTGIDLRSYKNDHMIRRLTTLMHRCNASSFAEFARLLESNPRYLGQFLDYFTINVSEFFRDPGCFAELEKSVLPRLLQDRNPLKIWSAGCSNGAEPYSVAILLAELTPATRHFILATDIDGAILKKAIEADSYSVNEVKNVKPALLSKYFVRYGDRFALKEQVKGSVDFRQADLLAEPAWRGFDLIICRNVAIYFTENVKDRLLQRILGALRIGGIFFSGSAESIPKAREIGLESVSYSFYRRVN